MKKSKIIVPALAMLVMSTAATVTGTVAWFAMNKTVSASGMKVKAAAEGSLVISTALPTATTKATDVDFTTTDFNTLYASTHDMAFNKGLKYVKNAENINMETGLIRCDTEVDETAELQYEGVNDYSALAGAKNYYKDFDVYIAALQDGGMTGQDITITLDSSAISYNINKAISVDFYTKTCSGGVSDLTDATYVDTLNLAKTKNKDNGYQTEAKENFVLSNVSVPEADGQGAIGVRMRVYYDGALIETAGTAAYTDYTQVTGSGTKAAANTYYYEDNTGKSILTTTVGETVVENKWIVDTAASPKAYARSVEVEHIDGVTLKTTFVAANHVNG